MDKLYLLESMDTRCAEYEDNLAKASALNRAVHRATKRMMGAVIEMKKALGAYQHVCGCCFEVGRHHYCFQPCGHLYCSSCVRKEQVKENPRCYSCRAPVEGTQRVYI